MTSPVTAIVRAFGILVALAPALFVACNDRFDFDVEPPDAGDEGSGGTGMDTVGNDDVGSTTTSTSTSTSTSTATSTTGAEPDAGPSSGCVTDSDCRLGSLHCHPDLGQCVECRNDDDCAAADTPHCDTALFRCVGCTQDDHCPENSRCDALERQCAPSCETVTDCVDAHACNNGRCVACDRDFECHEEDESSGPVCSVSGLGCVMCREDTQCPQPEICDVLTGRCVSCLSTADCDEGSVCDPVSLECVD